MDYANFRIKLRHNSWVFLVIIAMQLCTSVTLKAEILNGDFELFEPGGTNDLNEPVDWECENYANVVDNFVPQPTDGHADNWKIDIEAGLDPFEGDYFVVLSTGNYPPREPNYAKISQQIYVSEGQRLTGAYFFGTCDYIEIFPKFNDFATISLLAEPNSALTDITLVYIDVNQVGSNSSMEGWEMFEYTFAPEEAGVYELELIVNDYADDIFESYLAVDGVAICLPPEYGDIDGDCFANLSDFALMASDWFGNCLDPNYLADPNHNCDLGTDLNEDGPVDINDLKLMTENWLQGENQ